MAEQLRPQPKYDAIVIIPYTSRIQGVARDKVIPERTANVTLSSYSAMTTEAARILYEDGAASHIIALGENTFGQGYPSTADRMKVQLVKKGVPKKAITSIGNLQDSDEQMDVLSRDLNYAFVAMDFHKGRVQQIQKRNNLEGNVQSAEHIIFDRLEQRHTDNPEKLKKIKTQLKRFTPIKLRGIETLVRTVNSLPSPLRKWGLDMFRKIRGGQTITDRQSLTSASKHLEVAQQAIREGKLKPGHITA